MLVFTQAILPYIYTRGVSEMKKRSRRTSLEVELKEPSLKESVTQFIKTNINSIQNFFVQHVRPVHLAIFYFFGAYYNFAKRWTGIRYVSFKQRELNRKGTDLCT